MWHLIQPLDLIVMNVVKNNYWEEVRQWLMANLGEVYNKYVFVNVSKKVWEKSTKIEHAIKGFEEAGIFPSNPQNAKKGKLAPASIYEWPEPLLEMEESFVNDDNQVSTPQEKQSEVMPDNHEKQDEPQPLTSKGDARTFTKPQEWEPMVITTGMKKFKMVEVVDEDRDCSHDQKIADALKIPAVKPKMKMGGVRMPRLPHCVSDKKFWDVLKEKEDKKKEEEEKEKCKSKCEAKAKAKRVKKAKKEAWRGLKHKRGQCKQVKTGGDIIIRRLMWLSTMSQVNIAVKLKKAIILMKEQVIDVAECGNQFVGIQQRRAIGCDTEYCRCWYQPKCTNFDVKGKRAEIACTPWVCKYCWVSLGKYR